MMSNDGKTGELGKKTQLVDNEPETANAKGEPLEPLDDDYLEEYDLEKPLPKWAVQLVVPGHSIPIQLNVQGKTLIGRSDPDVNHTPNIDLLLYGGADMGVSRKHAEIVATEKMLLLVDLGSTNGTFINDTRLRPNESYRLNHGDQIRIGRLQLQIYFAMVPFHAGIRIEREGAVGLLKVLQDANDKAIRRVLIVEDDEAIASMFAALLKLLGYETQVVNRTGEAMRMIAKQLPHVIFLDSNLPDLPGTEVCRMLRNDMSTSSLPIFMISEDTSQENIESALSAGADMFLSKPVGLDELLRAMAKFVGGANPDKPYS